MTPERLAEIRACCEKANRFHPRHYITPSQHDANLQLLEMAKVAVPDLLAEVERLQKENETLQEDAWKYRELGK